MTTPPRILKHALVFLAVLSSQGVSLGQSLSDVVLSLSDRQRVISQKEQVSQHLINQNNDPSDTDGPIPDDQPIDWPGVGTNPTQSAVDGLGLGEKMALLNRSIVEFDRLKSEFLNANAEDLSGSVIGTLKPLMPIDFDPLPRATPANYHEVLRLLAQRIKTLQVVMWPSAFRNKSFTDYTTVSEIIVNRDPSDLNGDGNLEPEKVISPEGITPAWTPSTIGPGNHESTVSEPSTAVSMTQDSSVTASGTYDEAPSGNPQIPGALRSQGITLSGSYSEEARVSATATGGQGTQITGTVYILRRSGWNQFTLTGASAQFEKNQAGYIVAGSGTSGSVPLFTSPAAATVSGSWVTRSQGGGSLSKTFVANGYLHGPGSDAFNQSYENLWEISCTFHSVFKPTFSRGLDAPAMRPKLVSTDGIRADNSADGQLSLHPRPGALFGIRLGPGLTGAGNGYISGATLDDGYVGPRSNSWGFMTRFDSTYSLRFAGTDADYRVVYDNDRAARTQTLPDMGWPLDSGGSWRDPVTLYYAWDSPRIKQVAGRDLVADVEYNENHYGGFTIKIYRRPTSGSALPAPGTPLPTSGMTLIRTWEFSRPGGGSNPHPSDAEKLEATGTNNEKYEILATHVLPNGGIGRSAFFWEWSSYGTWGDNGEYSWDLKLSQDETVKYRKTIGIVTSEDEEYETTSALTLSEYCDGTQLYSLTSTSLIPFNDRFPENWSVSTAGKTITGTAAFDDPWGDRRFPNSLTLEYDGIQPDASYTWDSNGLLTKAEQLPWYTAGEVEGGAYKQTHRFNGLTGSIIATDWTELDGGNKAKTYSAPDGNAGSKSHASVAWSEVEYGSASNGLPGLPFIVRNSDGSGATYGWNASTDGSYVLTLEEGLLSGISVSNGTKVIRNVNSRGFPTQTESFVRSAKTGGSVSTAPADFTAWGMPKKATDFNTSRASTWDYSGNLSRLSTHTGFLGVVSNFSGYDVLGRPGNVSSNGIHANDIHYNAFSTTATISGGASGSITDTRDALGRLTNGSTTWNGVTDTAIPDRSTAGVLKITGNHTLFGDHRNDFNTGDGSSTLSKGDSQPFGGADGTTITVDGGLLKTTKRLLKPSGSPTNTFTTTWTDAWGRVRKISTPPASGSNPVETGIVYQPLDHNATNAEPQRVIVTDKTGRVTITETDPISSSGILRRSGIDVNGNGSLGAGDRYVESLASVSGSNVVTVLSLTEDSGLREILRTTWTPNGNKTVTKINGNEETITRTPNYSAKTVETGSTKGWEKNESFNNLGLTTSSVLSGTGVPAATLTPTWNDDGSLSGVTFTTGGDTHSATFKNDGTLLTLNAPGKGNILGGHSISGGVETLTVDGTTTEQRVDGTLVETSGGDTLAKTEELSIPTTGADFNQATTPVFGAATNVSLNAAGAPTAKSYAAGAGESYTHTPGGLLSSITLARGGDLTFGYSPDGAKDLESATWPQVTSGPFTIPGQVLGYTYDRAARVKTLADASGSRTLGYDRGRLANTVWNSGPLAGYKVVRGLDDFGRDTGFELWRGNTMIHSAAKTFTGDNSETNEVFSVTSSGFSAILGRNGARSLESVTRGSVTQRWQRGTAGRILLADSNNTVSGAPAFDYKGTANDEATAFDAKGRRLKVKTAGADWTYQYTNGQLTSASHPTLGSFYYQFDGIGRRKNYAGSGNWSDLLNQTLDWENTQNKTLKIAAHPDARVWLTVGADPTFEISGFTGSYEHPLPFPSGSGFWQAWNTLAVLEGQGDAGANADAKAEQSGAVWVPPTNESFEYDDAGNRESTALWDFGWNAKNELVRARTKNLTTAAQGYDITFDYDAEGRRFGKKVIRYQNGQIAEQKTITFVWDGWDLLYERHQLPSGLTLLERKYLWGPDIADGSAGGAGGLLLIRETKGNTTTDIYPLFDGTGHVTALTNTSSELLAEYAYGPFGEKIHANGPLAQSNPWRYATKYFDAETGLYYYGKRYLDPVTGQFLSREPLGESESLNLYSYCHNDPINHVDKLGLASVAVDGSLTTSAFGINTLLGFSTNINAFDSDWWQKASETERQTWEYLVADIETAKLDQAAKELADYKAQFTPLAVSSAFSRARMIADPDSYLFYRSSLELAAAENPLSYLTPAKHDGGFIPYLDGAYNAGGEKAVYLAARPMQFLQGASNLSVEMSPLGAVSTLASAGEQFKGGHQLAGAGLLALAVLDVGVPGKLDAATVTLRRVDGMAGREFSRKATALLELGEQGALFRAGNPVARNPAITREYRQNMIRRIWAQYGARNPVFAEQLIHRVRRRMDVDHIHELQLGGLDASSNLRFLDSFTNWHVGTQQIWSQIRDLPVGTPIRIHIE
jgi:RHS repeat-associated protein